METLKFKPVVYRVTEEDHSHGPTSWDLLTVDGETPNNTAYFMLDGDMPSHSSQDYIANAVENKEWKEMSLEESGNELTDFDIDISVFDSSEGHEDIKRELKAVFK